MRFFAVGDPQAPIEKFKAILARHGVIDSADRIERDTQLLSIGDHFDWGSRESRQKATENATALFAWLLAHPPEQTIIILGNHDLARVGELANFDQATYEAARDEADPIYAANDAAAEKILLQKYPSMPTAESLARDFSTFEVKQRELVTQALRDGRAKLAHALDRRRLFVHAAITRDDLAGIGVTAHEMDDARIIAEAINSFTDARVKTWRHGRLDLAPLHVHGDAHFGEGRGIAYQRPSHPDTSNADLFEGPPRRRFDPRNLPLHITQIVGHIRDQKCRKLLGPWVEGEKQPNGALRSLWTDGRDVRYTTGVQPNARMIFIDGSMSDAEIEHYDLFRTEL